MNTRTLGGNPGSREPSQSPLSRPVGFDPGRSAPIKPEHRVGKELVRWEFVPRWSRKGYLTRNFYIDGRYYKWLSSAVTRDGLLRLGIISEAPAHGK